MGRRRRGLAAVALAAGLVVSGHAAAWAHPEAQTDGAVKGQNDPRDAHQHGDSKGHLPASRTDNIEVVSKTKLKNVVPEKIADVGVLGNFAYLAAWGVQTCKYNGVHVVNIADVNNPREVAFIGSKAGSYPGEGIQALPITTKHFNGKLLVSNNEKCNQNSGFGGLNLYDVTRPKQPVALSEGIGDFTVNGQGKKAANEIHSIFAWDAGDRAYAVIVDNEEALDVDIMDITNPKKPFLTAEYDLGARFPQILQDAPENLTEVFLHDMIVKEVDGRQVMLASYWDGGYVQLDVTDVKNPTYIGDTDFANPDPEARESGYTVRPEGNAHQAEYTDDGTYVVGADEDFAPFALDARNTDDDSPLSVSQGSDTTPLEEGQTLTGESVYVGRACDGDAAVPAGGAGSQIAVVERGVCDFTVKVGNVIEAGGYEAVVVFNREGADACSAGLSMSVEGDIPTFGVATREQGYAIFDREADYSDLACLAGDGSQLSPMTVGEKGDTLSFSSQFDGWGYVRLFENEGGKMTELDTYAVPEAHDPAYAEGFGDLSVHEVATSLEDASRLYFSYYSAGFRVAEIENGEIVEKGHYIADGGSNFWGVERFERNGEEYVATSDRDYGLWLFKYNG